MLFKNIAFCIGVILALVVTVFSTLLQVFFTIVTCYHRVSHRVLRTCFNFRIKRGLT